MNIVKLYILALLFHFVWCFVIGGTLYFCGATFSQNVASSSDFTNSLFLVPMCALLEEIIFRWAPMVLFFTGLAILVKKGKVDDEKKTRIEKYGVATLVIVTSIIFGLVHGNVFNILIQGVSGVIFSIFYLRTLYRRREAGKNDRFQMLPLASSTIYHTLSNMILIVL